jgi:hypothetical protein
MNRQLTTLVRIILAAVALTATSLPVAAQSAGGAVTMAVTGRAPRGGEFTGTATINKVEQRGTALVAVGILRGTLSRGNRVVGSALVTNVEWPVHLQAGGIIGVTGAPPQYRVQQAGLRLAQAPEICPVVNIVLGPFDVNVLGVVVALEPIALDLHGQVGTPLGDLVCQVSDLIGNVAGLVGVVNGILGLLTGLLGGLTGGLGGIVPTP